MFFSPIARPGRSARTIALPKSLTLWHSQEPAHADSQGYLQDTIDTVRETCL